MLHANAEFVYTTVGKSRKHILSWEGSPETKLFNSILRTKFTDRSVRLKVSNRGYSYQPTDEYKSYFIRMKGIK